MQNFDEIYKTELNFVEEFNLSRAGMLKEIETEFNIIRLCISQLNELDEQYIDITNRIIVMPLRKLLCEKNSVLLKVCPDFKMPKLKGFEGKISDDQYVIRPPFITEQQSEWIGIDSWLEQQISWFDRSATDMTDTIPKYSFEYILKRLNDKNFRSYKNDFESLFYSRKGLYKGEVCDVYSRVAPDDVEKNTYIFDVLNKIGYNSLSVYTFLKHLSDKRGAHLDVGHSALIQIINTADDLKLTPVHYFAIQMIYAAKKQIPELSNYWKEMLDLSCT